MSESVESLVSQAENLPAIIEEVTNTICERVRTILSNEDLYGVRQVIFTGTGDSLYVANTAALTLRALTGLCVYALPAIEASRYIDSGHPILAGRNRGLLVVLICPSGDSSRMTEAALRLTHMGAITVAITVRSDSCMSQASERHIELPVTHPDCTNEAEGYVVSLISSYVFSIRIAEVLMCISSVKAEQLRKELSGMGKKMAEAVNAIKHAEPVNWHEVSFAECLGCGPSLTSALYLAACLKEICGIPALAQDIEEFRPVSLAAPNFSSGPVIVFSPSTSQGLSRQRELADKLCRGKRPVRLISDDEFFTGNPSLISLPEVTDFFAPLLHAGPALFLTAQALKIFSDNHHQYSEYILNETRFIYSNNSQILMLGEGR